MLRLDDRAPRSHSPQLLLLLLLLSWLPLRGDWCIVELAVPPRRLHIRVWRRIDVLAKPLRLLSDMRDTNSLDTIVPAGGRLEARAYGRRAIEEVVMIH